MSNMNHGAVYTVTVTSMVKVFTLAFKQTDKLTGGILNLLKEKREDSHLITKTQNINGNQLIKGKIDQQM